MILNVGHLVAKVTESTKRSLTKTVSWRILATLTTFIIGWGITGNIFIGLGIASVEFWAKLVLYYFHERLWNKINWGITNGNKNSRNGSSRKRKELLLGKVTKKTK
jgi:uncharacterized membrane protein